MCKDTAFNGNREVISEKISNFAADLNIFSQSQGAPGQAAGMRRPITTALL
jgi:hypothetical protein